MDKSIRETLLVLDGRWWWPHIGVARGFLVASLGA